MIADSKGDKRGKKYGDEESAAIFVGARMTAAAGMLGWRVSLAEDAFEEEATDPRVAGIAATTIGIDTHNHVDVPLSEEEMAGPDIDLAGEMKRSGGRRLV